MGGRRRAAGVTGGLPLPKVPSRVPAELACCDSPADGARELFANKSSQLSRKITHNRSALPCIRLLCRTVQRTRGVQHSAKQEAGMISGQSCYRENTSSTG